jgi:hypothetical protein
MRYSPTPSARVLFGRVEVRKIRTLMSTLTAFIARMGALLVATVAMLATAAALLGTQPAQADSLAPVLEAR